MGWDLNGQTLNVYGALNAEWETAADAINAAASSSYLYIQKGGKVALTNANINLSNTSRNDVYVYDGGVLEMTGGSLYAGRYITVNGGGTMTLNGTTVKQYVTNSGTINLEDVTTTNYIVGGGMVNARNSKIGGSLEVTGKSVLENVTCLRLNVDSDSDVTTQGQGVTMTGEMAFLLMNFSGSVEKLLNSISWTSTAENAYVGIHNSLNDVTLSALPDTLSGGYKSHSSVTINSGKTVTLEEGVCLQMQGNHLYVSGTLVAENEAVADAITGLTTSSPYLYINNKGKVQLKNANVTGLYRVRLYSGGTLEMEGGTLDSRDYLYLESGSTATLDGVTVKDYINNYGTLTMTDCSISSSISGSGTLTLENVESTSYISSSGVVTAKNVNISSYLAAYGNSTLEDVSCARLNVDSATDITTAGTGVTITGTEVIRLVGFKGNVQEMLDSFDWTATNEGEKYIGVNGDIYTSTLTVLPDMFVGGYKATGSITVKEDNTVTLEEGACLQMQGNYLYVSGTLVAENEAVADAITGLTTSSPYLYINDKGKVQLKNANVTGMYRVYLYSGGTLEMEGGTLDSRSYMEIASGAMATLDGVTVKDNINNYGTLTMSDCSISGSIYGSGTLTMENVESTSYISSRGKLTAKKVNVSSYLSAFGNSTLEDVSCARLDVDSATDITTAGAGVTISGTEVIRLVSFKGNVQEMLDSFDWTATNEGEKYIGVSDNIYTSTLTVLPDMFVGGYKATGSITVKEDNTVTLEEGACLQMQGNYLYVSGTLVAENEAVADAITGLTTSSPYLYINDKGKVQLKNANVTGMYRVYLYSGGTLEMKGGTLDTRSYLQIREGSTATLDGVTVKDYIYNYGTLSLSNSTVNNTVYVYSGSSASITGCAINGTLQISMGSTSTTITGNDFSKTTLKLTDTGNLNTIDLSGNYWGTTDINEIISRISGYDAEKVIINDWLAVDPTTSFVYVGNSLPQDMLGQGVSTVDIYLSHEIDESTVDLNSVQLMDVAGNLVELTSLSVEGKTITIGFEALQQAGVYRLVLSEDIKNVVGDALLQQEGQEWQDNWRVVLSAPKVSHIEPGGDFTGTLSEIVVYFTEVVDIATLKNAITVTAPNGSRINATKVESIGGTACKVYLPEQTNFGRYTVTVSNAVTNIAGNRLNQDGDATYGEQEDGYAGSFAITDVDLTLTSLVVDSIGVPGDNLVVSWTGENATGYALFGTWSDGVYLSTDTVWDINDIHLGTVIHDGGLAEGETYSGSYTCTLPGVSNGQYYILVRSDINGQEVVNKESYEWVQNLEASPISINNRYLIYGDAQSGRVYSQDKWDYYIISGGSSTVTRLYFEGLRSSDLIDVYVSYGESATVEGHDVYQQVSAGNSTVLLTGDYAYQDVSIMVRQKGNRDVTYSLKAEKVSVEITTVSAQSLNVAGECIFDIYGYNFSSDMEVCFYDESGKEYAPASVELLSTGRLRVQFEKETLPTGVLGVRVSDGECEDSYENAVTMVNQSGGKLLVDTTLPSVLGYHMISNMELRFANIGYEAISSPLVLFSISQNGENNAFLTTDSDKVSNGFWTSTSPDGFSSSISFLVGNGSLTPITSIESDYKIREEITTGLVVGTGIRDEQVVSQMISYTGWKQPWDFSYPDFQYEISIIDADNAAEIDWNGVTEGCIGNRDLENNLSVSLQESMGATWGEFVQALNKTSQYLDTNGADVSKLTMDDLVGYKIDQQLGVLSPFKTLSVSTDIAVQTTGLSLSVDRVYYGDVLSRTQKSVFGYGWTHNWDITLSVESSGDVALNVANMTIRFQPSYQGGYICSAGDAYSLKKNKNGTYFLTVGKGDGDVVYNFSSSGVLQKATDVNRNSISCSYDSAGRLTKLTHSNGEWIAYEYNGSGYVSQLTASNGASTQYLYKDGNLTSVADMLGDTLTYRYHSSQEHALTGISDKNNQAVGYEYNKNGLVTSQYEEARENKGVMSTVGMRRVSSVTYNADGSVTIKDAHGASSTYHYDTNGRVIKAVDVYGNVLRYRYNDDGVLQWQMDQAGNITSYSYNADRQLMASTNALGNTTRYSYTASGQTSSITDANGNSMLYKYDGNGQCTSITYADGSVESWTYDSVGNVSSWTSRAGNTITMTYDRKGNLLTKTVKDETSRFTYNEFGHLLSSTDSGGTTVYSYDERYRLTLVEHPDGHSVSYTYDSHDRVASMTDDSGNVSVYAYNMWGDLLSVTDGSGNMLISYEYDGGSRLIKTINGNGTYNTYSYTLSGAADSVVHYSADGEITAFYRYTYDKVGLRTSMATHEGIWTYGYDKIGQLIKADFAPAVGSDITEQHIIYEYDAVGNRTRTVVNGKETLYTNNELNQTVSAGDAQYEYDADGNLIRKADAEGITTYEWSAEGKLLRMTNPNGDVYEYSYNAGGERVSTVLNGKATTYVYDGTSNNNVLAEYDADGKLQNSYRYGNTLIGYEDAMNGNYWYQGDALGSVTGITDASGNLVATYTYDPYGNSLNSTGSLVNPYQWLGLWGLSSDESGLTHMRARYYDEETGTFISADPIGVSGGINLYAYCMNNSLSLVDPSGTISFDAVSNGLGLGAHAIIGIGGAGQIIEGEKSGMSVTGDFLLGIGLDMLASDEAAQKALDLMGVGAGYLFDSGTSPLSKALGANLLVGYAAARIYGLYSAWKDLGHDFTTLCLDGRSIDYHDLSGLGSAVGHIVDWGLTGLLEGYTWLKNGGRTREEVLEELRKKLADDLKKIGDEQKICLPGSSAGSSDPNDLIGVKGYGEQNFISGGQNLAFMLRFENEETATAPARWIRLNTTFDEGYDLDTFTLNSLYLAGNIINVAAGQDSFNQIVTMNFEGKEVTVDIRINLDHETRELKAEFMAVDPLSGTMLQDMMTGMLYPNDDSGRGDGYITYSISTKDDLPTGTTVANVADIYFDFNDVIPTPEVNYTIDSGAPQSCLLGAEDQETGGELLLTWDGTDETGGSGVNSWYIYLSENGGDFALWNSFAAETTSAVFTGRDDTEYGFYIVAVDNVGNVESGKGTVEVTATPTTADVTPPAVVETVRVLVSATQVAIIWQGVADAATYTIRYALTPDFSDAQTISGLTSPIYTIDDVPAEGNIYVLVSASDVAGNTSEWSSVVSANLDVTPPAVVQGVQAITGESGVAVSWNVVEDAASYTLEYATKPDFSDAKSVTGITGASYALTALPGTGTLYVRVASADAAGNVSAWSAVAESALDITAPGAVQGLEVMAHGTSARLSWDAVSDASGIAGYRIEYAVDGDFTKAQSMQVNSTEATFYTLLAGAAYQWRVAAVDGAGNVGEWSVGEAFRTGTAEPEDDSPAESREIEMSVPSGGESHSTTRVNGWVGFDDPADYYCFTAKGEGAYAISLDAAVLGTQVYLSVGILDDKGNFAAEKKLLVAPGSAAAALGGIALESGEKCYIRVESYDKGLGRYNGEYSLSVEAEVADSAWVTDNNSPDKATMLNPGGAADAALSGWVGMGDAVDYYCFELTKPAELSLVLGELDAAVKVKLLREERDGGVSQVMSRSVKASRGLDHTLSLTSGTYFVEVASYDNGAGRYNTTYALELEKEEENGETKRFTLANT